MNQMANDYYPLRDLRAADAGEAPAAAAAAPGAAAVDAPALEGAPRDMHHGLSEDVIGSPVSVEEAFQGSLRGMLSREIGAYIAAAQMQDAVKALIDGDGSKPGITFTAGTPDYSDFVELWGRLAPFQLNTVVAGTAAMEKLLQIAEFKDAQAGMNFQGTGKLCTPLGAKLIHVPGMEDGKIIGLDKTCALELVQAGDVVTDYDKLIDRQLERAAISVTSGFARICEGAAQGISYTVSAG